MTKKWQIKKIDKACIVFAQLPILIKKLLFLKKNVFPQNSQLDTKIGFSKTPPKSFLTRGRKKFSQPPEFLWKKFPKNASKNSFVHVAFDLDNIAEKPLPDSHSFVDQCPKRRKKFFGTKNFLQLFLWTSRTLNRQPSQKNPSPGRKRLTQFPKITKKLLIFSNNSPQNVSRGT